MTDLDKILQAMGATDVDHALRMIAESQSCTASLQALSGRDTFAAALPIVREKFSFVAVVEAKTGKTGADAVVGVIQAGADALANLTAVRSELTAANSKLETYEINELFTNAKAAFKIDKNAEDNFRGKLASGALNKASLAAMFEVMPVIEALKNARTVIEPPREQAPAPGNTGASKIDPTKKYEDYTPTEISALRESGEMDKDTYKALRQQWERAGRPPVKRPAAA